MKNTLAKSCAMAMIANSVGYMAFGPKGNSNSRSEGIVELETIQSGGKLL